MPVFRLDKRLVFPPVDLAEDGLLAVGGDLSPERLLLGYSKGIFPWYGPKLPILWHSPDPRMVLATSDLVINRSLRKAIRRKPYELRIDTAFAGVLAGCVLAFGGLFWLLWAMLVFEGRAVNATALALSAALATGVRWVLRPGKRS